MIYATNSAIANERSRSRRRCYIYRIIRLDRQKFYFTSYSQPVRYDGFDFSPGFGVDASALRSEAAFRGLSATFTGVTSGPITLFDLQRKLFHGARIDVFDIDPHFPHKGQFGAWTFYVDSIEYSQSRWTAQCSGLERFLKRPTGDVMGPNCRAVLGDKKCGRALGPTVPSAFGANVFTEIEGLPIDSVQSRSSFISTFPAQYVDFQLPGTSTFIPYFRFGVVKWTSGLNRFRESDIMDYDHATGLVSLWSPPTAGMQAGDEFTIVAGCDGARVTCINKFANSARYWGFDYMEDPANQLEIL